jgi:predicted aspartyl protease
MSFPFQPGGGPIYVDAQATGPAKTITMRLILDTGATTSLINRQILRNLGYDLTATTRSTQMVIGSGVLTAPLVVLTRFSALGQHRFGVPVIAHDLPAASTADGLLGLDFLRGQVLTIDFKGGQIALS